MKRALMERNIAVVLFILVMITFSFAQRDTEKITHLYTSLTKKSEKLAAAKSIKPAQNAPAVKAAF